MSNEFGRILLAQQRGFDNDLAEFRRFFESLSADARAMFRDWLTKVQAVYMECPLDGIVLPVKVQAEMEIDEEGNVTDMSFSEFSPSTMLEAIARWEVGDTLTPQTVLP